MGLIARGALKSKLSPGKEGFSIGNWERSAKKDSFSFFPFLFLNPTDARESIANQRLSSEREFRNSGETEFHAHAAIYNITKFFSDRRDTR